MKRKLRILAIHGLWEKSSVFGIFKEYFKEYDFFAPNIKWEIKSHIAFLDVLVSGLKPDVIIGYSYGAYAVQRLFEHNPVAAGLCVLIAPVGPKGIGLKSFFRVLAKRLNPNNRRDDNAHEKFSTVVDILPFIGIGKVPKPIRVPTLIISGDRDEIVSCEDAEKIAEFHGRGEVSTHYHFPCLSHKDLISVIKVAENIKLWIREQEEE